MRKSESNENDQPEEEESRAAWIAEDSEKSIPRDVLSDESCQSARGRVATMPRSIIIFFS